MLEVLEPEGFVRADWEELFREATRGLDPWALDITVLIGRFREFLTRNAVELRVPGRMVLASSVLLRMKSERMEGKATLAEAVEAVLAEEAAAAEPEVYVAPELRLPLRRKPKARLTVADLRRALLATLSSRKPQKEKPKARLEVEEPFRVRALRLLRKLLSMVNGNRIVPFSQILESADPGVQVARFLELLHLDGQGKIRLHQPEFLGEILIEVPHDP